MYRIAFAAVLLAAAALAGCSSSPSRRRRSRLRSRPIPARSTRTRQQTPAAASTPAQMPGAGYRWPAAVPSSALSCAVRRIGGTRVLTSGASPVRRRSLPALRPLRPRTWSRAQRRRLGLLEPYRSPPVGSRARRPGSNPLRRQPRLRPESRSRNPRRRRRSGATWRRQKWPTMLSVRISSGSRSPDTREAARARTTLIVAAAVVEGGAPTCVPEVARRSAIRPMYRRRPWRPIAIPLRPGSTRRASEPDRSRLPVRG